MPWENTSSHWGGGEIEIGLCPQTNVHGNWAQTLMGSSARVYKVTGGGRDTNATNGYVGWKSWAQTEDQYDLIGYPFKTVQYPSVIIHHMRASVYTDKGESVWTGMKGFWAASPQRSRMMSSRLTNLRHGVAPR